MSQALEAYLRRSPLTDAQRADLWDAFESAESEDALAEALKGFNVHDSVKADLWDMKAGGEQPEKPTGARPIPPGAMPGRGPLGGPNAQLSAGEPEGMLSRGYGAVKEAVFGHPDRAEARAAGIGLQPTPAEMAGTAIGLGGAGALGGGMGRLASMVGPTAARVAGPFVRAATSPVGAGAIAGAGTLIGGGSVPNAIENAALTTLGAKGLPAGTRAARAVIGKARPAATARTAQSRPRAVQSSSKGTPKATEAPAAAPEMATPAATSRGAAVAVQHKEQVAFAKEIAAKDPKVGEKIWMLLDEAGKPVRMLTPDQAGAAARKGLQTTWIRNLWSSGRATR